MDEFRACDALTGLKLAHFLSFAISMVCLNDAPGLTDFFPLSWYGWKGAGHMFVADVLAGLSGGPLLQSGGNLCFWESAARMIPDPTQPFVKHG